MRVTRFQFAADARVVIAHENITERKRAQALERESTALKDAMAGMEQVLGVVGHELRTPLAGLRAMIEYLTSSEAQGTPEWTRFMGSINDEVVRMSDTVDNLLEAARLDSGRARWNWSCFDLATVCREVVDHSRHLLDPASVKIIWRVNSANTQARGDASAIRRLLLNLVSNARKHTVTGLICVTGRLYIAESREWIELQVADTGAGMGPEVLSRLGQAFALNSGVVGANCVGGTGLGLAICKGIVAAHGGWLTVQSAPGRGTTICAVLRADLNGALIVKEQVPILKAQKKRALETEAA